MSDSYRCILVQEQLRHGQAYDVTAADNHYILTCNLHISTLQELDNTLGCAGQCAGLLEPEVCHVHRVETVNILLCADSCDNLIRVDMLGQRQLHQDAVNAVVVVQLVDNAQKLLLRDRGILADCGVLDTNLLRSLSLTCNVRYATRILTNEDYNQVRYTAILLGESGYVGSHLLLERESQLLTIYNKAHNCLELKFERLVTNICAVEQILALNLCNLSRSLLLCLAQSRSLTNNNHHTTA